MVQPEPFSIRHGKKPDVFRYEIDRNARLRILAHIRTQLTRPNGADNGWFSFAQAMIAKIQMQYGHLDIEQRRLLNPTSDDVESHFLKTSNARAIDFIEFTFAVIGERASSLVDGINQVFQQEGLGFEVTPFLPVITPEELDKMRQRGTLYGPAIESYPLIIPKTDSFGHTQTIQPALAVLQQQVFKNANEEMMRAFIAFRNGDLRTALNECEASFETLIKTICHQKGWAYKPATDTISNLIDILVREGMVFDFYADVLKNAAKARNKMAAHGQGPNPQYKLTKTHIDHALMSTASHIVFLARLAAL